MEEWYNGVQSALRNHSQVTNVQDEGVHETNKVLSPNHVGGCYCKTFKFDLASSDVDPWNYVGTAASIESELENDKAVSGLLTADDDPVRMLSVDVERREGDEVFVAKAFIIPDPE